MAVLKLKQVEWKEKFSAPILVSASLQVYSKYCVRKQIKFVLSEYDRAEYRKTISKMDIHKDIKRVRALSTTDLFKEINFARFPMALNVVTEILKNETVETMDDLVLWMTAYSSKCYYGITDIRNSGKHIIYGNACWIELLNRLCYDTGIPLNLKDDGPLLVSNLSLIRFEEEEDVRQWI